jgi:DNA-binding GntR family transcriptional regulator
MQDGLQYTVRSLREEVYNYLKVQMNDGKVEPGTFLNLNLICRELKMSRTPLRDALFQLEAEGFVTIYPRRGVLVNTLTLEKIRNIYEILAGLESEVIVSIGTKFRSSDADVMAACNEKMRHALDHNDFAAFYAENLNFHNVYLNMSENNEILHCIKTRKERLYDFPRSKTFVKEWEVNSLNEHQAMIDLFKAGDFNGAAEYVRDVHWSFPVQERFIRRYYFAKRSELDVSQEGRAK